MNAINYNAAITMRKVEETFSCNNIVVLTLSIHYPEVVLYNSPAAQAKINADIAAQVRAFHNYAAGELYQGAISDYKYSQKNGFPFHRHEAVMQYEITYNQNCHLSLYSDQYTYTGGAHGNTIRSSATWNLVDGRKLPLASFFPPGEDYSAFLLNEIIHEADSNMQQNPGIYFDDYRELIIQYFNEKSYYLTMDGLALYYQQYEIAPYATGIVVFTIPYGTLRWRPACIARR